MLKNKSTRALIITMCALVILGISIAHVYYKNLNDSVDPRIKNARVLYDKYNEYAQAGNFDSVFWLLDTIESVYNQHPHYQDSYEIGVLYNNRAAAYLTLALHSGEALENKPYQDSLVILAKRTSEKSITLYNNWLNKFKNKNQEAIGKIIKDDFITGLEHYEPALREKLLTKRGKEIEESILETERRLSVSYTNLGVANRHEQQYEMAAKHYKEALDLWDKNLTAENNLNLLLGRPLKKRNLIQKLFPPKRN